MSTLTVATVKSNSSSPPTFQNTSGTEVGTLCRAWVNFNGTGTVAIRAQFNVSSITDNGTGNFSINFTSALSDTNFTVNATAGGTSNAYLARDYTDNTARTTSQVSILCATSAGTGIDPAYVNVAIFR